MNKTKKTIISSVLTVLLVLLILAPAGSILSDKFSDNNFLDRQNVKEFYSLPKNSIDVLIGGNSQILAGYCAPQIFEESGITSFGLGTCSQPVYASYYWLKEALKTQSPKVYMLEVSGLYGKTGDAFYIKAFSEMKNNLNKFEAAKNITDGIFSEEFAAYFSDIYRYASRWHDLKKGDYGFIRGTVEKSYLGYAALEQTYDKSENINPADYPVKACTKTEPFVQEENEIYLRKIVELCREKGIEVALFKTVKESWTDEMYTAVKKLADDLDVKYFDMNTEDVYKSLNIDCKTDFYDPDHLNYIGAKKTAKAYIDFLTENFELTDHRGDAQGEFFKEVYNEYSEYCKGITENDD